MDGTIHYMERTISTQHEARRLIKEGSATAGDAVVADHQINGKGRFGRSWISPSGGLYATVILSADPLLSLKAGVALVRVLRAASIPAGLKWPNDVLADGLKIAGVLIESDGVHSLVGIGLNLMQAPLETATCVATFTDAIKRDEWAENIVRALVATAKNPLDFDAYRKACLTLGRRVRVEVVAGHASIEGVAADVDDNGRLVMMTVDGERIVSSGECFHLRASTLTVDPVTESQWLGIQE